MIVDAGWTFCVAGADKNFALEQYGEKSRCFDHSNEMWEERSCRQVRQWQHWGSGCYRYKCEDGRLHIIVNIFWQIITKIKTVPIL